MKDTIATKNTPDQITQNLIGELESMLPSYMAAMTGMQFKNHRDFYTIFGWERRVTSAMCSALYNYHGIARAVNDTPVDTTWRYKPQITSTDGFAKQIDTLDRRIRLYNALQTADRVSGIGQFGIIVLGIRGQSYEKPLRKFKLDDLVKLEVFQDAEVSLEMEAAEQKSKEQANTPRYYYGIKYYKIGITRIHPSRVIHIAENSVDGIYGHSRLLPIYNQLHDMWKISGSSAEQFYISASLLLSAQGIDGFKIKAADGVALQEKLLELVNRMKGFLVSNGFEIKNIAPDIVSPKDSWEVMEKFISATSRIPRRILFGSEMGQLASTQDQNNYYERIESRQKNYVTECIINVLFDKLIAFSDLEKTTYSITWHKLSSLTDKEVAESVKEYGTAYKYLSEVGVDGAALAAIAGKIQEMITSG